MAFLGTLASTTYTLLLVFPINMVYVVAGKYNRLECESGSSISVTRICLVECVKKERGLGLQQRNHQTKFSIGQTQREFGIKPIITGQ
jgi:hypothetical protein